ncbi:MAG: zinc ABC transporter substrate-binding protein [Deltaproteobacteria bacterium]|nr:zinc ABC transporter substrate-binding protein [Deltaproteobacteria bacterium]
MWKIVLVVLLTFTGASPAWAELNVVATLPWIGSLAKEIGQDKITVTTLVKPSQDPHLVEAKPSMILAGRKADILMYNGLDLEIGYLPLILESSRNPRIVPGQPGNLDCSRYAQVIEKSTSVDRSMGDVHPLGNPHYHFSPPNMLRVASGMTDVLAGLDRNNGDFYRENFKIFSRKLEQRLKDWQALNPRGKKFVAYHKLFEYLAAEFGLRIMAYVEPKPGIPPSAAHVEGLIDIMKSSNPAGILTTGYYGRKEAESLGGKTGVKVIILPADVGAMEGTEDWFAFMDKTLTSLP